MKKIPTLFVRDFSNKGQITHETHLDCGWVFAGEGRPTVKWDGTSVLIANGQVFKRHELRPGKDAPMGFMPADEVDPETGKQPGWIPIRASAPDDRWFFEALGESVLEDGTYELVGPKVQGNPHGFAAHTLVPHGKDGVSSTPVTMDFPGIRDWVSTMNFEGVVWHHPDGRRAKIKRKDFGFSWPLRPIAETQG